MIVFFFFKQKTAYEMRISDWSSDVCSSDLCADPAPGGKRPGLRHAVVFHSYCRDAAKRLAYAAIGAVFVLPQRRRAAVEHEGYLPGHDSVRGDSVSGRAAAHRIPDTGHLATKGQIGRAHV